MKKAVLYFLTGITSIWFINVLLSGFTFKGGELTVFLVALFIVAGVYLTEWVASRAGKKADMVLFFIISVLLNFFSLYFATLVLDKFSVSGGSLTSLDLGILDTPIIKSMDQILTLLLGALIATLVAVTTKWASKGSSKSKKSS